MTGGPVNESPAETSREHGPWVFQFLRFITVGLMNTAVELIVYNVLLAIHNPHSLTILTLYSTLGVVAAIVNSYLWNSRWAFRGNAAQHGHSARRQRFLFVAQALVNIAINDVVTVGLTQALTEWDLIPLVAAQNLAKVVAMATSSVSSYLMLRWFVFTPPAPDDDSEIPAETSSREHHLRGLRHRDKVG